MKKLSDILYVGIFFWHWSKSNKHITKLKSYIPEEFKKLKGYKEIEALHVTTGFGMNMSLEVLKQALRYEGQILDVTISSIGVSDKCIALGVSKMEIFDEGLWMSFPIISDNKHMHITLATANGGKPVESSNITNWVPIEEFTLEGIYNILYKNN